MVGELWDDMETILFETILFNNKLQYERELCILKLNCNVDIYKNYDKTTPRSRQYVVNSRPTFPPSQFLEGYGLMLFRHIPNASSATKHTEIRKLYSFWVICIDVGGGRSRALL